MNIYTWLLYLVQLPSSVGCDWFFKMALTSDEKKKIGEKLGGKCTAFAPAAVRLYVVSATISFGMKLGFILRAVLSDMQHHASLVSFDAQAPLGGTRWQYTGICGAAAVVINRDLPTKPYFIQLFDLENFSIRFSEEIYEGMEYIPLRPAFYAFETSKCMVGLSFAKEDEAAAFQNWVTKGLPKASTQADANSISLPSNVKHVAHVGHDLSVRLLDVCPRCVEVHGGCNTGNCIAGSASGVEANASDGRYQEEGS